MKSVLIVAVAAGLVAAAWGEWLYEGQWGTQGSGDGEFNRPTGITAATDGSVYVADTMNDRVQYFTPTGSFGGKWGKPGTGNGEFDSPSGVAVAPSTNVYVADTNNHRIQYFTETGSYLGKWGSIGAGDGQFRYPSGLAITANGNVYVADTGNRRIQYFTSTGSFRGKWGCHDPPNDVAVAYGGKVYVAYSPYFGVGVAPDTGYVFFADGYSDRIQYFSPIGEYLGKWGKAGSGNGEFDSPSDVALSSSGARAFVADAGNHRIQYFNRNEPAVSPTSFGRVKALFK